MTQKKEYPYCFGKLENVFPMGPDGLRCTPESCMICYCKTECLRTAAGSKEGIVIHEEKVDREYESGVIGFFSRWSRKKALNRKKQ